MFKEANWLATSQVTHFVSWYIVLSTVRIHTPQIYPIYTFILTCITVRCNINESLRFVLFLWKLDAFSICTIDPYNNTL